MRRSIGRLTALTALLALCGGFFGAQPAQARAPATPAFGVQFHAMWSDYTDVQRGKALDALRHSGATWVRIDVSWAMLQPKARGQFSNWGVSFVDRVISMTRARGLKPLVTLWLTPAWANSGRGERVLPTDVADYAAVAEWAAARWAGRVAAWEVWNEPNLEDFMVGADPVAYTRLLRAAYPAFHRGDPSTRVVAGAVVYNDDPWISRMYAAGLHGYFDVLSTHPYQAVADEAPDLADNGKIWRMRHVTAVRRLMVEHGDGGKPIWFTEFGWSSHANPRGVKNYQRGVTERQQADYLVRTLRMVAADMPFVTNVFWYNERNRVGSSIQNDNYGLMRHDLTPKPALVAVASYLRPGSAFATRQPAPRLAPRIRWLQLMSGLGV